MYELNIIFVTDILLIFSLCDTLNYKLLEFLANIIALPFSVNDILQYTNETRWRIVSPSPNIKFQWQYPLIEGVPILKKNQQELLVTFD